MDLALAAVGTSVRVAGAVSPRWGAAVAMPFFAAVERPRAVRPADEPTMWRARRRSVRIAGVDRRGVDVQAYEWGDGDRTAVLSHGWNGRASQFATLVRELVAEGWRVVAFDAPAHGLSTGRRTYLVDWLDVFAALQQRYGAFDAVVGHSFGGLAALVGAAGGVDAARVVTIASPADADLLLSQFQRTLGYSDAVARRMHERFASRYFPGQSDPFAWLSSVRRPLPADAPLLVVHDEEDRMVPFSEARRILSGNPGAQALVTRGLGHNRVLAADVVLDAVLSFLESPSAGTERAEVGATIAHAEQSARPEPSRAASARDELVMIGGSAA